MAKADIILFVIFGAISAFFLAAAILSFRKAMSVARQKDGDIKMFLWAVGTFFSLIVSGLSAAYILLPIFLHAVFGR